MCSLLCPCNVLFSRCIRVAGILVCFEKGQDEEMSQWGCGLEKTRRSLLFVSLRSMTTLL
jgi:hypothetical protein